MRWAISRAFHAITSPALTRSHSRGSRCRMVTASPISSRAAITLDCCANANDDGHVSATNGVPSGPIRTNRSTNTDGPAGLLGIVGLAVTVRPRRRQQQLPTPRPPLRRQIVRSQAEQRTRIPERLLQPRIEHADNCTRPGRAVVLSSDFR